MRISDWSSDVCSSDLSGVVRRHPDIRWLRREADLAKTAALQRKIIDSLWQTVKPGGHLLYATCSIFPQEGEHQATRFLERHRSEERRVGKECVSTCRSRWCQ